MWQPDSFTEALVARGMTSTVGVPDSTLKEWIATLDDSSDMAHICAVNECEAVAVAIGQYMATGAASVVYMQNDGLGKIVNPHTTLCSRDVYSVPMLFVLGWRGEPGESDAPQHHMMGRIMAPLLELLDIPSEIMTGDSGEDSVVLDRARQHMMRTCTPFALIVRRGLFESVSSDHEDARPGISREEAIRGVVAALGPEPCYVATTGKASRELYEIRTAEGGDTSRDFYVIGGMGCASSIGLGMATRSARKICVLDGDGALLMQMGSMGTIGRYGPPNLLHIVLDNEVHDSTGGQPTASGKTDFAIVAKACGYYSAATVRPTSLLDIEHALADVPASGPSMLVVKVRGGARPELGRPAQDPCDMKRTLMAMFRDER